MSDDDASSHHSELQPISSESSSTRNPSPRHEKPDETEKASEKKNLLQFMRNKIFPTKVHVPEPFSFTKEARRPLTRFMDLVGLHEGHNGTFSNWMRRIILFYMFACTLRRVSQLGESSILDNEYPLNKHKFGNMQQALFNPGVIFSVTRLLFTLSGLLTGLSMGLMCESRKKYLTAVDAVLDTEESALTLEKAKKLSRHLVYVCLVLSLACTFAEITGKLRQLFIQKLPWASPLIKVAWYYLPFEGGLTLFCECAIVLNAVDFYSSCTLLRYVIADVCQKMRKDFSEAAPLVKLQYLDEIQGRHFHLLTAKRKLEDCYSLTVFLYYFIIIPCICFLAYVSYRNYRLFPGIVYGLGTWMVVNIILLLIISIPAFQLTEEGEEITTCAFELYQNCLKGEDDPRISSQMLILIAQIESHKITISAHNYFPMHRGILLTMFSAVFTYFLILVQFGGNDEPMEMSSCFRTALEMCKNTTVN